MHTNTTEKKTWDDHLYEAKQLARRSDPASLPAATRARLALAVRIEEAHGRAVMEVTELLNAANEILGRLESERMNARVGSDRFLAQALMTREALLKLEHAREACSVAMRIESEDVVGL